MSRTSLVIFVPAYGENITAKTTTSLVGLAGNLTEAGMSSAFVTYSYFDLVRIRNLALTFFIDRTQATHLLYVDADMSFDPIVVRRMLDYDVPLVGAVYPTRSRAMTAKQTFVASFLPDTSPNEQGFMKVRGLGGGLLLVRRDCVERMLEHDPSLNDTRAPNQVLHGDLMRELGLSRVISGFSYLSVTEESLTREFGEDLSFCERARNAGIDVWGNVGDPIGHVGVHEWYGCWGKPLPREAA